MVTVKLKRAYEPWSADDGWRVYVDRLWPRGLSHEDFRYDVWLKDIAPSTELREWFHVDREGRWQEFVNRYKAELRANASFARFEDSIRDKAVVTLLFSSRDTVHDNAVVVKEVLTEDGV